MSPPGLAVGAVDEARTRDPQLGKLMLYQLSYYRIFYRKGSTLRRNAKEKDTEFADVTENCEIRRKFVY